MNQFNYGKALQKSFLFYEAQRTGQFPEDYRIAWREDSPLALTDGSDVGLDLTGGYYDAGDLIKFNFPMASSMTLLAWGVNQYENAYQTSGQFDEALAAIKWGTDYFLKSHVSNGTETIAYYAQIGTKQEDQQYWQPAQEMTIARPAIKIDAENPGSDLAAETAAALAAASMIFQNTDSIYSDTLLENSIQLYEFAETYLGKYSDSLPEIQPYYNSSGYQDELAWGAIWLYQATGNSVYLDKAKNYHPRYLGDWSHSWDSKEYGTAVLLALETGEQQYLNQVETWLDLWVDGSSQIQYTEGGFAIRNSWGSLGLTANTAFLASIYSSNLNDDNGRYSNFILNQINYILGDNPRNFSYLVGFGDNYPLQPHHKNAHEGSWSTFHNLEPNAHVLYGALVGGLKSADDFDYQDLRSDYVANEVALDYNAGFTGALAYLYDQYGGEPLSDRELDVLPEITINFPPTEVMGEINRITNFNHIEQTIQLQNDYTNPVVFAQPLSFNGADPAIVRITDIDPINDTVSFYLQEPEYKDGWHLPESFSFLVLEAGTWQLEDGTLLEVGTVETNQVAKAALSSWENIDFSHDFIDEPVIVSQVQTNNGKQFVRTRQRNATADSFLLSMEEEEALRNSGHLTETIGWLAMESNSGNWNGLNYQAINTGDVVNSSWFDLNFNDFTVHPNLVASIASYDGPDPSGLRYREITNTTGSTIQIKIEEDQSFDQERIHTTEEVNFLAIEGNGILSATPITPENNDLFTTDSLLNWEMNPEIGEY